MSLSLSTAEVWSMRHAPRSRLRRAAARYDRALAMWSSVCEDDRAGYAVSWAQVMRDVRRADRALSVEMARAPSVVVRCLEAR